MADIRIEKKKPLWPWLLLIVIIAVVVFLYVYGSGDNEDENMQTEEIEDVTSVNQHYLLKENDVLTTKNEKNEHTRKAFV